MTTTLEERVEAETAKRLRILSLTQVHARLAKVRTELSNIASLPGLGKAETDALDVIAYGAVENLMWNVEQKVRGESE